MSADEPKTEQRQDVVPEQQGQTEPGGATRQLSRMERLKQKLARLQGKNPDIYPMW